MATALEGVKELTGQLTALGASVAAKELKGTAKEALQVAEHRARANIPVGIDPHKTYRGRIVWPGFAQASIHIETRIDKRTGSAIATLGVSREAFYAVSFVEVGTSKMDAQPWLRPAFEQSEDTMLHTLATRLRERVDKAIRRRDRTRSKDFKNSLIPGA